MTDAEKPTFLATIAAMSVLKPGKALTADAMELFWRSMRDAWSLPEFKAACEQLNRTSEFMPNPYHFEQLRKASLPTAGEAFENARQIVRRLNPREFLSHKSGDPRLDSAIRACGGYEALAMCTSENIGFFERRFAEHFESISDADDTRLALPALARHRDADRSGPKSLSYVMGSLADTFEDAR